MNDEVLQPFTMEITPIKKLTLLNFEKHPETIYKSLELQYFETKDEGKGFVLIAYRNDGYVDVYMEKSLHMKDLGNFEVCDRGLKHYRQIDFDEVCFDVTDEGLQVAYRFKDYKGRLIDVVIREHTKKKSRFIDLVAPVGASSRNPACFPAFAIYQFDLVRTKGTTIKVQIDGKDIIPDPFPVPIPKDGQMRYFARYGYDCELVEFGKAQEATLQPYLCTNDEVHMQDLVATYKSINNVPQMKSLQFEQSRHTFKLIFEDLFPNLLHMSGPKVNGRFKIEMDSSMGYFSGNYEVTKKGQQVTITLIPSDGWVVQNKTFITKLLFQRKSLFRTWPTTYCYKQVIDLNTLQSTSSWERIEYKELTADWIKGK